MSVSRISPPSAVWSLSDTAGGTVTIARSLVAAATGDNVNALAIVACREFGNTLAICYETERKVEKTVLPPTPPVFVRFLQALVGYDGDRSANELGQSVAGLKFCALLTALVTTIGPFESAKAVEIMLRKASPDDNLEMIPRTNHLNDLFKVLESRCHRGGFATSIVGWQVILSEKIDTHLGRLEGATAEDQKKIRKRLLRPAPSAETVSILVDAFRQIARIGTASITNAKIETDTAAPWIVAFTTWCLGIGPSIQIDGKVEIESDNSLISVSISTASARSSSDSVGVKITIYHQIGHHTELISKSSGNEWIGMAPIREYGKLLISEFGTQEDDTATRALYKALSLAVPQVISALKPRAIEGRPSAGTPSTMFDEFHMTSLPTRHDVETTYTQLFDAKDKLDWSQDKSVFVRDLPLVKIHLAAMEAECGCEDCSTSTSMNRSDWFGLCKKVSFYRKLGEITTDIICLSLVDSPPECPLLLQLSTQGRHFDHTQDGPWAMDLEGCVLQIIETGEGPSFLMPGAALVNRARFLVGHGPDVLQYDGFDVSSNSVLITTSGQGQVMYPTLFEQQRLHKAGYLRLTCLPGALQWNEQSYKRTVSSTTLQSGRYDDLSDPPTLRMVPKIPVSVPFNAFEELSMFWKVSVKDIDTLECNIGVRSGTGKASVVERNPMDVLQCFDDCFLMDSCKHPPLSKVDTPDAFNALIGLSGSDSEACDTNNHRAELDILPVSGADDLRLFGAARGECPVDEEGRKTVIRQHTCLECCLNFCRVADASLLIL